MRSASVVCLGDLRPTPADWFVRHAPRPDAAVRLFCFPWSGASAGAFRSWAGNLPAGVETLAVELPGHGRRSAEAPHERLEVLARQLTRAVRAELADRPGGFAFFGHSFGALLAYEVARRLAALRSYPELVVVSGNRAPAARQPVVLHRLTDDELLTRLAALGGTPADRLRDPEFRARTLPLVRADLTASETYRFRVADPLPCPVSAWAGNGDWYAGPHDVARWRGYAGSTFRERIFDGGHFFTCDRDRTLAALTADLAWCRAGRRPTRIRDAAQQDAA